MKQDIKSMNCEEIAEVLKELHEPSYRAKQIFVWLHKGVKSFDQMTNLSKSLREKLDEEFYITAPEVVRKQQSEKDGTIKYLWKLRDGNCVETVNYDAVLKFLELINCSDGMNIGMRHISLSTCGLVDKINRLAEEKLQITLSVSLHAPLDEIRSTIMPVNRKYNVETLLNACRAYFQKTGRRISFEYAMIRDVNDSKEIAEVLAKKLQGIGAHVNLIPLNNIEESPLKPSTRKAVMEFQKVLEERGFTATVRRTLGSDIDASCGQLRRKYEKKEV